MKQIFLASLMLLGALTACTSNDTGKKKSNKKELRVSIDVEPISLDPRRGGNRKSQNIIQILYEGLVRFGKNQDFVLGAAEKYEVADDYKSVTFHLRDCYWSNGVPVTAFDFVETWKEALDPEFDSAYSQAFFLFKNGRAAKMGKASIEEVGIKALDEKTIFVEFEKPLPNFLDHFSNPYYYPVYRSESDQKLVTNGPFVLSDWKGGREIKVVKNDLYWDKNSVSLAAIDLYVIEDTNTALLMWERGELDIVGGPLSPFPLEAIPEMKSRGQLQTMPSGGIYWLVYNTDVVPFNSPKIRKALSYAIDRQSIVDHLLQGGEVPATSILPQYMALQAEHYFKDANIEEAKKLFNEGLAELGLTRETLGDIELNYCTAVGEKSIAQALQNQWVKTFDVSVNLLGTERKVYLSKGFNRDFQIRCATWYTETCDPSCNMEFVKERASRQNMSQWENPEFRHLIDTALLESNICKRQENYHEAEKLLMNEMPLAPVFYHTYKMVKKDNVDGFVLTRIGLPEFKYVDITS